MFVEFRVLCRGEGMLAVLKWRHENFCALPKLSWKIRYLWFRRGAQELTGGNVGHVMSAAMATWPL